MSSSYELCPAIEYAGGVVVVRRVEKAYPVFLRCAAGHFAASGPELSAALAAAERAAGLEDFAAATARLVGQATLRPFDGGTPVLLYVARPGKEQLFLEFAEGLDQADGLQLLHSLPDASRPLVLVFGAAPAGSAPPSADPLATLVGQPAASGQAVNEAAGATSAPTRPAAEPDQQPQPAQAGGAGAPEHDSLPSVEVLMTTTSALDSLLGPAASALPESVPPPEQASSGASDLLSEPALEILLRQAPRLQSPGSALGPVEQSAPEASHGPVPEEVLAAVRQVVGALDDALRRQSAEHQAALKEVAASTALVVQEQGRALEVRQAQLWEQQQAALRQMHADQAAAIKDAIVRLDEERAAWQSRALRELQQASSQQLPGALRQLQDDLAGRQQQALTQLRDDLLSKQPAAAPPGALATPGDMQELNWQLEKSAVSSQDLRARVGQLLWVNLLLLLVLVGLAVGAAWLLRDALAPAAAPTATLVAAATATLVPPTPVPPTQAPATAVPATPTTAPTATTAATALPVFLAALRCANADRPRNFYDCELTNAADVSDTLALSVLPAGEALNGFRPLVLDENLRRVEADPITGLFVLGEFEAGETRALRVMLPCAVAAGCGETSFVIRPLVDGGETLAAGEEVAVTTHYFPPDATTTP